MRHVLFLLAIPFLAANCISKPLEMKADHLVSETGTISLEGVQSIRFRTHDGFDVSTGGGIGELNIGKTRICGPLSFYRAAPNSALPAWAPPTGLEYQRFLPVDCLDRANIASTTMTVQRADAAASAICVALLPLCILANSVPGQ